MSCNAGWHAYAHRDGERCPVCKGTDWEQRWEAPMDEIERELGLRVVVDGTTHPIHDDVRTMSATLRYAPNEVAEIQIARAGSELVVIVAGDVVIDRDQRGHLRLMVAPTPTGAPELVVVRSGAKLAEEERVTIGS